MAERPGPSSTFQLQMIIGLLTIILKIGRYLPYIVFAFATLNLTLAVLDFTVWDNLALGVLNVMLAIGGSVLTGQLLQRRIIRRSEYFGHSPHRPMTERANKESATMNVTTELRDQEAA